MATSLAEQRPGLVTALALINTGPSPSAKTPDPLLARLLTAPLAGRLLWRSERTRRHARHQVIGLSAQFLFGMAISLIGQPSETTGAAHTASNVLLGPRHSDH